MQIHDLPSYEKIVQAKYYKRVNNVLQNGTTIPRVVIYSKTGMLENGALGIKKKIQISQTYLEDMGLNDVIEVDGKTYQPINPQLYDYNLAIDPFWEAEVKTITIKDLP